MRARLARAWRRRRFLWGYFLAHLALVRANRRAARLEVEREQAEDAGRVLGFPDCESCRHVLGFGPVTCAECRRALEGLALAATAIGISPRDMAAASVRLSYALKATGITAEHLVRDFALLREVMAEHLVGCRLESCPWCSGEARRTEARAIEAWRNAARRTP